MSLQLSPHNSILYHRFDYITIYVYIHISLSRYFEEKFSLVHSILHGFRDIAEIIFGIYCQEIVLRFDLLNNHCCSIILVYIVIDK